MNQKLTKILTVTVLISAFFPIYGIFAETYAQGRKQESIPATTAISLPFLNSDADSPKVSQGQRLAMFTKPAVVRILDGYRGKIYWPGNKKTYTVNCVSRASGFFINSNGYIVTNAHATSRTREGDEKGEECLVKEFIKQIDRVWTFYNIDKHGQKHEVTWQHMINDQSWIEWFKQRIKKVNSEHIHHVVLPNGSRFPFEIKAYGAPVGQGKDVAVIKIELENTPSLRLANSGQTQLQEHITVAGYPGAAETSHPDVFDQTSSLQASFTDGKISSKKRSADGAPLLQISAPISPGSSGGPIVNDKGEVVGIPTFKVDKASGFSFAVSANTIMEFVKQAGTNNEQGAVNRLYEEGLELYWQRYYTKAIEKFEDVKRLFPQHSEVEELIQSSQEEILAGNERTDFPIWSIPVILGSGAGLAGTLYYQRRRKQKQALSPSRQAEIEMESDTISAPTVESNMEKFAKIVETCHGQREISSAQMEMLEHFRQKYDIPQEVAEQLIVEATQQTDRQPNPQAFYEFGLMYRAFLEHDQVQDPEENAELTRLQEELGLTNEQVIQIETRVKEEARL